MNIRTLLMPDKPQNIFPEASDFSRCPELEVFKCLDQQNIKYSTETHLPTHTVAESSILKSEISGGHTKNLFLKDKKGQLVLISAWAHTEIRLNQLHKLIESQRLSFAKPQLLWETLKVTAGSVSAFALMHDTQNRVRFLADEKLLDFEMLNFHPLRNDMTTSISQKGFARFIESTGRGLEWIDFNEI
ncbi:prolyl-tRNA synthetase associated domain-containing protein [Hirschia baltica]|uniref:YbaK/prolyl-tRNA synthetase associated region n=1 Tax=Hirschia baltica (strain ATCC 49814 / DSM 5838 / IFAM 1418) TaxID=582402 RepID=C6XKC8_HIRBI|nr:prolyl-tRNA synthetase associated domain-containing protein [Hirschia baltica]ACT57726.1 YbaK/prolyl-tRNA synthetase associated region [Hirschia baltica ATCC 49814]